MNAVDEFLDQYDDPERAELARIRRIVRETVPEAEELISYCMPSFKYKGKYLIGYCAFKKHLSLFPTSGPIEALKDKLEGFKLSKGTIQFTIARPIPESLIKDLVLSRLADILKDEN